MSAENLDLIAGWASLILTLLVFSYLLADNFLYRIAVHLLVGTAAGFAVILAFESVILPWLDLTVLSKDGETDPAFRALGIIPFLLGLFVLLKGTPRFARVGNWGVAVIIGVGTGVAVVGAVAGTIIPLARDASESFEREDFFNALVMVLGTVGTLIYFQYLGKRRADGTITRSLPMRLLAGIGRATLAVTFGAIYGGIIITSLTVFSGVIEEQIRFLLDHLG